MFIVKFFLIILTASFIACKAGETNPEVKSEKKMENKTLTLQLKLTQGESLSYGTVYLGEVTNVIDGALEQDSIRLMILAKKDGYADVLDDKLKPNMVQIEFEKKMENVEKSFLPINGFVDERGIAWEIIKLE